MANEYTKQAQDFLKNCGAKMTISFKEYGPHFDDDKESRNIYQVRINRNSHSMSFKFGDSIASTNNGGRPTAYDVLACLQKYDIGGDVWDFSREFGYDISDRESYKKVERIYKAVKREYTGVLRLFGDVLDELREIQ